MKHEINNPTLSERVITLIENARRKVASVANVALVYTYYEIGRMIVEDEQGGMEGAAYGDKTLAELSEKLTVSPSFSLWGYFTHKQAQQWFHIFPVRKISRRRREPTISAALLPARRVF